jgi:hypothetical protein
LSLPSLLVGAEKAESASGIERLKAITQPSANESQFTIHGSLRRIQQFGCLFCREPEKEAKLYHPALARVELLQFFKDAIEVDHLRGPGVDPGHIRMEGYGNSAIPFLPALGAGVIDQNAAHEARRKAVEVFAIFKPKAALSDQLQEQFVDYACRLEQILRALAPKEGTGYLSELGIDKLEEVLNGRRVTSSPVAEKYRDFACIRHGVESLTEV